MLFWKITAQSVLILCEWNPSYLMVVVFVSWSLYLQPILFHRKFLKERKNLTSLNDTSPWKSISESGSLQKMRDDIVFSINFFFWLKEIKERFLLSNFFYSCSESPLITDLCKALQLGSNKFLSLHGHMMKWLLTEVDWAWQWHFSFLLKKCGLHCSPPTKSVSTYLKVLIDCQSEKRKIT